MGDGINRFDGRLIAAEYHYFIEGLCLPILR